MANSSLKKASDQALELVARRFRALSEPSRLKLIRALQSGGKNVSELVDLTGLSQPNVSRHLQLLLSAGLIGRKKDGLTVVYRIIDTSLAELCAIVCKSVARR
jgi:ArsR family transcriptional regulator